MKRLVITASLLIPILIFAGCGSSEEGDVNNNEVPDVNPYVTGTYQSSDEDCVDDLSLSPTSTEDVYDSAEGDIIGLTMTGSSSCIVTDDEIDDERESPACSYADDAFTITYDDCTAVMTKISDEYCGDGTCNTDIGERVGRCPTDCGYSVSDLSFMDDHNWTTTSPDNDCLEGVEGNTSIAFSSNPAPAFEENYAVMIWSNSFTVSRNAGNICIVDYKYPDPEPQYCAHVSICAEDHIAASGCLLPDGEDGEECSIDIILAE